MGCRRVDGGGWGVCFEDETVIGVILDSLAREFERVCPGTGGQVADGFRLMADQDARAALRIACGVIERLREWPPAAA